MEASTGTPSSFPNPPPQPNLEKIKQKLLKYGVQPTPRILHNLRKKEIQKSNRRLAKQTSKLPPPLSDAQREAVLEESHFRTIKKEYNKFTKNEATEKLVGKPWEGLGMIQLRELSIDKTDYESERLNPEHLMELSDIIECERDKFSWILDKDIDLEDGLFENEGRKWAPRQRTEAESIKFLVDRFVYTKLLAVLGRARKPREALQVFNLMRGDGHIYPDMAAYHSLAVTLGQAGLLKELLSVIESMKIKPKKIRNMRRKNWNPELQPDNVIFNAVLNACVAKCQWKGVAWVFQQLRKNSLRPDGASYGLAMEVMLKSGKYDLVHEFFGKMKRNGKALKALTYKVLVRAFWEEGKVDEAVQAVRDMERRGVIGTASVYYELACCLCFYGRWQDAIFEIKKLKDLGPTRPLAVAFTGMIKSAMDGGHVQDCVSIYEHSKTLISPDIGLTNAMLKVYGRNDLFLKARELFEEATKNNLDSEIIPKKADAFTFGSMLEASARALQWEYFEHVYKEMTLSGHRFDQSKHSALLVEASINGKWHLLEHAFDSILEAGEIPHVSFFTEMMCQATIRRDYDRAEKLFSCDIVKEATVLNLTRALQFICGDSLHSIEIPEDKDRDSDEWSGGLSRLAEDFEDDLVISPSYYDEGSDSDIDEFNFEDVVPSGEADGLRESGAPSALEILETWKAK
ncbi:hypothetical protein MIMGU_mgv1a002053mg [Erythranthe guttata]|uniref:Pentacotripeptide-repeat region of PRORP domain-containing protein n=1 Tax=Erythranthe guttata TaxID=4155 RepID=A0A022RX23_ERYGU|nr:hypothetical protein MIMGU_mgv1a002053mg [Erythranthe guttata]